MIHDRLRQLFYINYRRLIADGGHSLQVGGLLYVVLAGIFPSERMYQLAAHLPGVIVYLRARELRFRPSTRKQVPSGGAQL